MIGMEGEVFGPYRLVALIGRGGMGEVFEAFDTRRNRVVALKRLPRQLAVDDEYRARFQRESALVARLNEPHIIPIHDYGEIDGQLFIDMRLVDGGDLAGALVRSPMTVHRAVDIVSQIADALDAAHGEGLVHRDVKPPNVLLVAAATSSNPDRGVAYLADFGIARATEGPTLSQVGLAMGSAGYMAPERFTGDAWDRRVDVYSLACVLYECLVGHRPFPATSLPAAMHAHLTRPPPAPCAERAELPRGFDEVIARGMAKDPEDRYPTAGDLAFAARRLLAGPTVTVSGPIPRPAAAGSTGGGTGPRTAAIAAPGPPPAAPTRALPVAPPAPPPPAAGPEPVNRRRALRIAGGVVAAGVLGGAGWGALKLTGLIDSVGPWTVRTGDKVYSSPLLADGVVYVGSNDHDLRALAAGTGAQRWRYPTGGSITSSPAVAAGVVHVGGDDQLLHAVDAATGQRRWVFDTGGVVHSSPTVAGGVVFVGSRSDTLVAVDAATGAPRWRFRGGDCFNSSPAVANGLVHIGCRDHNVYGVDAATGAERWRYLAKSTVDSSPRVVGNTVYIGSDDYRVLALDARTGALIWEFWAQKGVVSTPAVAAGLVYVGSDDGNLYALEADTGRERWRYPTAGGIRSSPAVGDGIVYVGSQDRFLHAVDALRGTRRWMFEFDGPVDDSSPAAAGGLVYVGSLDGTVRAVDAVTGTGAP